MKIQNKNASPTDRGHLVAAIVFLIGVATLLPWNFMVTANDFWMYKFRDIGNRSSPSTNSSNEGTLSALQLTFNSYLTVASGVPLIVFLVLNTAISERMPLNPRIEWSIFLNIVVFAVITCTAFVNTDRYQNVFLACTLATVVIVNSLAGVLSGGGTGAIGFFPERYMAVKAIGQSVAGVLACIAQVLCLQMELSPTHAAVCYFAIATLVLILAQTGFWWLKKSEFYRFYVTADSYHKSSPGSADDSRQKRPITPFFRIFMDGWEYHIAIALTLLFTLACFPAIAVLIRPGPEASEAIRNSRLFVPIICFTIFNVADCLGRVVAGYLPTPMSWRRLLLLASVLRSVFIPLFLICNVAPENRSLSAVYLPHDWQYVLIMTAFGASNGYLITVTMAQAPKVTSPCYQEVAGSMVVAFDAIGIFIGAMSSVAIVELL